MSYPLLTTDMVALTNVGGNAASAIEQAAEPGSNRRGQRLAGLHLTATSIEALGLPMARSM